MRLVANTAYWVTIMLANAVSTVGFSLDYAEYKSSKQIKKFGCYTVLVTTRDDSTRGVPKLYLKRNHPHACSSSAGKRSKTAGVACRHLSRARPNSSVVCRLRFWQSWLCGKMLGAGASYRSFRLSRNSKPTILRPGPEQIYFLRLDMSNNIPFLLVVGFFSRLYCTAPPKSSVQI